MKKSALFFISAIFGYLYSQVALSQEYIEGNTYYDNNGRAYFYDENGKAFYYPEPVGIDSITDNAQQNEEIKTQDNHSETVSKKRSSDSKNFINPDWWKNATLKDVKAEIDAGADVNAKIESGEAKGMTPLMEAARYNENPEVIKALIGAGADINAKDKEDHTVLMIAANFNKNHEVIRAIIEEGADVNYSMKDTEKVPGWTALMHAVRWNPNIEITKILIDLGADVNAKTTSGGSVLLFAARGSNPEIIKELINAGANVNAKDNNGKTALMDAVTKNQNPKIIKALIDSGLDVNAKNNDGWTPLIYAARDNKNPEIIKALIDAGADIGAYAKDPFQTAALVAILRNPNHKISEMLIKPEIDNFCNMNNNYSHEVYLCKDRLNLYFQKEHQLPSCTYNMTAMLAITPFMQAAQDTDPGKGVYAIVVIGNMMSNFNCSFSNTFKTLAGH